MAEIFKFRPDKSVPVTFTQRTRSATFGGYKQTAGDGLNTETQSWSQTFSGSKERIIEILAFLRAHQGYKSFIWATPLDGPLYFTCGTYGATPQGGNAWALTATFEQTFQVQ